MIFSLSTVLNTTVILGIGASVLLLFLNRPGWYRKLPVKTVLTACIAIMFRYLMPFEFPFTISVPITKIWPHIYLSLRHPIFTFSGMSVHLYQILFVIWIVGSASLLLRLFFKYLCLNKKILQLHEQTDPFVISVLDSINRKYQHSRHIRLVISDNINTAPYITGIFKPTIVLPNIKWNRQELSFILGHELTHFYNYHLQIKIMCEIIAVLYFWNPFVYMLKWQVFRLLELETDSVFTAPLDEEKRLAYAECMLNIARSQYAPLRFGTSFAPCSESALSQRIQILLGSGRKKKIFPVHLFTAFITLVCILNFMFVFESANLPQEIEATTMRMNKENTFLVPTEDGYDIYYEGEYLTSVSQIFDSSIPIHETEHSRLQEE